MKIDDFGKDAEKPEDKKDDEAGKDNKVSPEGAPEDEDYDNMKTEEDTPEFIEELGTEAYINFAEFARYLSYFNPRTGLDEKISCKAMLLLIFCLVYFRIFDIDGDKKISPADLNGVMRMLFGPRMSKEDMNNLQQKIFEEADTGGKGELDQDDVQKVLWATNLEHKCSMHFFQSWLAYSVLI